LPCELNSTDIAERGYAHTQEIKALVLP
jgi:hypothetical protein